MSKRELAQIIEQQEWHDPRMWESNGDGVLVRKKKKKKSKETNYLCDVISRDDDDSDCNNKVTKSTEKNCERIDGDFEDDATNETNDGKTGRDHLGGRRRRAKDEDEGEIGGNGRA